jgi:Tfp pilus assembly protein PilV
MIIQNSKIKIKNSNRGQSIIEVVVALSLVVLVILALVKVSVSSINNSAFARDQRAATKYAQEGLENARQCKEENEVAFWNASCPELATPADTKFTREITYTQLEEGKMQVDVVVSWVDSKGQHESSLTTYLTKWE